MGNGDDPVQVIATLLRRYLAVNPDAADSIEGIRRWWLPSHFVWRTEDVERALGQLVQTGELATRQLRDGGVLYAKPHR